jgi:hypothetical protein
MRIQRGKCDGLKLQKRGIEACRIKAYRVETYRFKTCRFKTWHTVAGGQNA